MNIKIIILNISNNKYQKKKKMKGNHIDIFFQKKNYDIFVSTVSQTQNLQK